MISFFFIGFQFVFYLLTSFDVCMCFYDVLMLFVLLLLTEYCIDINVLFCFNSSIP